MRIKLLAMTAMVAAAAVAHGALELRLERGGDTWGYASPQNFVCQEWNGSPVTVTVEMELFDQPGFGRPILPWQSWTGIFFDGNGSRYALGLNNGGDASLADIPFGAVLYENSGHIQSYTSETTYRMRAGKLWLRGSFDNGRVTLAVSENGTDFREVWSRPAPEEFKPTVIGVCLNSSQATSSLDRIAFNRFEVKGDGPARSDDFSGAVKWRFNLPSVSLLADHWHKDPADVPAEGRKFVLDKTGDVTAVLQEWLRQPGTQVEIPAGRYTFGKLEVAAYCKLVFAPGAVIDVGPTSQVVFTGDHAAFEGGNFHLPIGGRSNLPVFTGENRTDLRISNVSTTDYDQEINPRDYDLASFVNCRDITMSGCRIGGVRNVILLNRCARVVVRDNRATDCVTFTCFSDGAEYLQHYGNWSSRVIFQCQWWGGDSNDHNPGMVPDTARIVRRDLKPGDADFQLCNAGVYDILVENNIAEYGVCLAWGSKGRNIIMTGNIARFMGDLAYDTEGGENVIISDNISINSTCAGIGCYFYGERLLIANNQLFTFDEGEDRYKGGFIRVHSPGSSDHFGNGEVLITGNQMVNETSRPVGIGIEACRNVVVSGNTMRNGIIGTISSSEDVTIENNVFINDLKTVESVIGMTGPKRRWYIRNNIFRNLSENDSATAFTGKSDGCRVVFQGNLFEGFAVPVKLQGSGDLVVLGNMAEGKANITGNWRRRQAREL